MIEDVKSILIDYISSLSEDIRRIEDDSKSSGLDLMSDNRYAYLAGKRESARHILDRIKSL